jgi:hypothetical protein
MFLRKELLKIKRDEGNKEWERIIQMDSEMKADSVVFSGNKS